MLSQKYITFRLGCEALIELIGRHDVVDQPDTLGFRRGH
jgi:hypothetical protein